MEMEVCQRCIRDFYTRSYEGNPKKNMDPNDYNFIFTEDNEFYNWVYWYKRGILYNCINVVPHIHPIGISKISELVPKCPHKQ